LTGETSAMMQITGISPLIFTCYLVKDLSLYAQALYATQKAAASCGSKDLVLFAQFFLPAVIRQHSFHFDISFEIEM